LVWLYLIGRVTHSYVRPDSWNDSLGRKKK
jgi:hypothetical protein